MKEYIRRSMLYPEYTALIGQLVNEHKTTGPNQTEALAEFTKLNKHRMDRLKKTIFLDEEIRSVLSQMKLPQTWLVITEAWCGDAAQNIPVIEKIAAAAGSIETRYVLRDEVPELIDRFLTNGSRAIPKVIALTKDANDVLWTWGARPIPTQELFRKLKSEGVEKSDIMEQTQRWYNDDRGRSLQREFIELMIGSGTRTVIGQQARVAGV